MTTRELIDALQTMLPDANVWHLWDGEARTEIKHIWLSRDGRVITADSSMDCYSLKTRPVDADDSVFWTTPDAPD